MGAKVTRDGCLCLEITLLVLVSIVSELPDSRGSISGSSSLPVRLFVSLSIVCLGELFRRCSSTCLLLRFVVCYLGVEWEGKFSNDRAYQSSCKVLNRRIIKVV